MYVGFVAYSCETTVETTVDMGNSTFSGEPTYGDDSQGFSLHVGMLVSSLFFAFGVSASGASFFVGQNEA